MNFQGFLSDLQDWEVLMKDKEKHAVSKSGATESASKKYKSNYGERSLLSSNYKVEETYVDANSEKDLGNDFFKQKKYNEAIDCYSRSIALSPTAVAYANRAMAYLKVKRFREAEADCTEALDLDDRYIKAYSRRATSRKELGNLKEALDDVQFALRFEPNNSEIKKQSDEIKASLEKAILHKASNASKSSSQTKKVVESKADSHGHAKGIHIIPDGYKKEGVAETPDTKMRKGKVSKQELVASVHELASRATSRAMTEAAKNISLPTSAYQFEVSWKGFCGDRSLQTRLLKVTPPDTLPQIFKNSLSISILMDIIKCLSSIFIDEPELVVKHLRSLTKVSRFDMLILCLPATEKADLRKTWDEVFLNEATPIKHAEILGEMRPKYCPGQ